MKSEIDPMGELMKACHCLHLEVADSIAFDVQDKARAVKTELDALRTQLKSVEAERDAANAGAAVMREAFEQALRNLCDSASASIHDPSWIRPKRISVSEVQQLCIQAYHQLHQALTTNAGKSLLLRLQEAEWIIKYTKSDDLIIYPTTKKRGVFMDWVERRDAFLNPKPQDVK